MEATINLRSCTIKDAEALVSLGIRTFRDTFDEYNSPEDMMAYINKAFTLRKLKEELTEERSLFFLAEADEEPVGYARVRDGELPKEMEGLKALELQRLYVDKKYIGKRVGFLLMNECLNYAKEHGYTTLWLGVWESNHRALQFYKNWGFEKFGQHIFQLGDDSQTDFLLKKTL